MLTCTDIKNIYSFFNMMKDKGYSCYFDYSDLMSYFIYFDFEYDAYEMIEKLVKDWIIFHSEIVESYNFEICEDGINCRFNLYVRERFL